MIKNDAQIRIGDLVEVTPTIGRIESGHAAEWYVRTDDGELTGPWMPHDLSFACHHIGEAGMMIVHSEDLETVALERVEFCLEPITCGQCDAQYLAGIGWRK